jgi:hypothetical protein
VFELLLEQGCPLHELEGEENIAHLACHDNQLPALQYCLNFANWELEGRTGWALLANAMINDQLQTAQWLKQQGVDWPPRLWMTDSTNVYKLCSVKALEVRALYMILLTATQRHVYHYVQHLLCLSSVTYGSKTVYDVQVNSKKCYTTLKTAPCCMYLHWYYQSRVVSLTSSNLALCGVCTVCYMYL